MITNYGTLGNAIDFRKLCGSVAGKYNGKVIPKPITDGIKSADKPAIGEIAGPDSIAAIIKAVDDEDIDGILPVVAVTGTEYGSPNFIDKNLGVLKDKIKEINGGTVFEHVLLHDPNLWWALNGRFTQKLIERYGFYSPCLGCHLYVHAIRIPLAIKLGIKHIISGERSSHGGRVKINQLPVALDSYEKLISRWGIRLILPLRNLDDGSEITKLTGGLCKKEDQFKCVFSDNYRDVDGSVIVDAAAVSSFYSEFGLPVTIKIVEKLLENPDVNPEELVKDYFK